MDLYRIIDTLIEERNRLDRIIQSLDLEENTGRKGRPGRKGPLSSGKRPGRKSMDAPARREVSERMKRYWAERRAGEVSSEAVAGNQQDPSPQK